MKLNRIDTERDLNRDVKRISLTVGNSSYLLSETNEGKLEINKIDIEGDSDAIAVYPRVTNVIEIE